jgi:hypothetical protein
MSEMPTFRPSETDGAMHPSLRQHHRHGCANPAYALLAGEDILVTQEELIRLFAAVIKFWTNSPAAWTAADKLSPALRSTAFDNGSEWYVPREGVVACL